MIIPTDFWCLMLLIGGVKMELCKTRFSSTHLIGNVMENTPPNTVIGYVDVTGTNDEVTITAEPHPLLYYDTNTRNVTLTGKLDIDVRGSQRMKLILNCQVHGQTHKTIIEVVVMVDDYNEYPPVFNKTHLTYSVGEDKVVGERLTGPKATDNDNPDTSNSAVTYRVAPGSRYSDYFNIEEYMSPDVTLKKELDFETLPMFEIYLEAVDNPYEGHGPQMTATATLTINVLDKDDLDPAFGEKTYRGSLSKDAKVGTDVEVVPTIVAKDQDALNAKIVYRIRDPNEMFSIDPNTAKIRTTQTLSVDASPSVLAVGIVARQANNPERDCFTVLVIYITTENIHRPIFSPSVHEVTRTETERIGSILLVTTATDADFGTLLRYDIREDSSGFIIDHLGRIVIDQHLDYEQEKEKTVHVTASDGSKTATATVKISVTDVNDNNPVLHMDTLQFQADRQTGYIITTLSATDNDVKNVLRFEVRTYRDLFAINEAGELSVAAEPQFLVNDSYPIWIAVLDNNGYPTDRENSTLIEVKFPPNSTAPPDIETTSLGQKYRFEIQGMVVILQLCLIAVLLRYILVIRRRMKEPVRVPRTADHRARRPDDLSTPIDYGHRTPRWIQNDQVSTGGSASIRSHQRRRSEQLRRMSTLYRSKSNIAIGNDGRGVFGMLSGTELNTEHGSNVNQER